MSWRNIFYVNKSSCLQHVQKHLKKSAHWKLIPILLIHEYRPSGGQSPLLLASSCFRAWTRQIIGSHLLIWYNFEIYNCPADPKQILCYVTLLWVMSHTLMYHCNTSPRMLRHAVMLRNIQPWTSVTSSQGFYVTVMSHYPRPCTGVMYVQGCHVTLHTAMYQCYMCPSVVCVLQGKGTVSVCNTMNDKR